MVKEVEDIELSELIRFSVDRAFTTELYIDGLVVFGLVALLLIIFGIRALFSKGFGQFEIDEAEFGLGNQKIKVKPNVIDKQIAYKIWVELSTRKIGLPIDLENDVISEVYDSWYSFFGVTRELIKEVPVSRFRRSDTDKIIRLSIEVLNTGVRPHLTSWQAKFRRWYEKECSSSSNDSLSPQEIQKKFPQYTELSSDLEAINKNLIKYREKLHQIVVGKKN
ncbi:MAG: hypothetical protein MI867_05915 [Pseudomonadales bacterium]|nr:hypothetical protein [Pseudomonadales bacterium]